MTPSGLQPGVFGLFITRRSDYPQPVWFHWFPMSLSLLLDAISGTGGKDAVGMKADEDASFPVKIQGAGVEPFELQV